MNFPLAKRPPPCDIPRMTRKHFSFFIFHCSLICATAQIPPATPSGIFDSAAYDGNGWLVNQSPDDSRYTLPVEIETYENRGGTFLDIALSVRTPPETAVCAGFGNIGRPYQLCIARAFGGWIVTAGNDALPFSYAFPLGTYGESALSLRIQISESGDILSVTASPPAAYVSPLPEWQGLNPGLWDRAELSLRGAGSAIGLLGARRAPQPSLILIR